MLEEPPGLSATRTLSSRIPLPFVCFFPAALSEAAGGEDETLPDGTLSWGAVANRVQALKSGLIKERNYVLAKDVAAGKLDNASIDVSRNMLTAQMHQRYLKLWNMEEEVAKAMECLERESESLLAMSAPSAPSAS